MKLSPLLLASILLSTLISFQAYPDDSLTSTYSDPYYPPIYPDPYTSTYETDPYNTSGYPDPCNGGTGYTMSPGMTYMPPPIPVVESAYSINNGVITVNPDNDVQISFLATYNPYNITQSWVFNTYFDINRIETITGTPVTNPIFGNATLQWNNWGSFNSMQGTDLIFQAIVRQNSGETTLDTTQTDVRILAQGDIAPAFDTNSPVYDALMNYVNYEGKMSLVDNQIMILFNFTTEDTVSGLPPETHEMALVVNFMKTYYYSPPPMPSYPMPGMGYGSPCMPPTEETPPPSGTLTPAAPISSMFLQTDPRLATWWKNFSGSPETLIEFVGGMEKIQQLGPAPAAQFPFIFMQDELAKRLPGRDPKSLTESEWATFLQEYREFLVTPNDLNGQQIYASLSAKGFRAYQLSELPIPDTFKTHSAYLKINEQVSQIFIFADDLKNNFGIVGIKNDQVFYKAFSLLTFEENATTNRLILKSQPPQVDLGYFLKLMGQASSGTTTPPELNRVQITN